MCVWEIGRTDRSKVVGEECGLLWSFQNISTKKKLKKAREKYLKISRWDLLIGTSDLATERFEEVSGKAFFTSPDLVCLMKCNLSWGIRGLPVGVAFNSLDLVTPVKDSLGISNVEKIYQVINEKGVLF